MLIKSYLETISVLLPSFVFVIVFVNLLLKLRNICPYRVNCWFCNQNFWLKIPDRNSWVCPNCDQYNGFTKDGDYNKPITYISSENNKKAKSPKSPVMNGLCKMCNINQQLKVTQLANFIPVNEKNFDAEIEDYRMHLEKAYKLCTPCSRLLQNKLHKEREYLLSTKLLQSRTPEKSVFKENPTKSSKTMNLIFILISIVMFTLICFDTYKNFNRNRRMKEIALQTYIIIHNILMKYIEFAKEKLFDLIPTVKLYDYNFEIPNYIDLYLNKVMKLKDLYNIDVFVVDTVYSECVLSGIGVLSHIVCQYYELEFVKQRVVAEILWSFMCMLSLAKTKWTLTQDFIKLTIAIVLLLLYKNYKTAEKTLTRKKETTPKPMKNLINSTKTPSLWTKADEDGTSSEDTDDDVSLSQYGINHNRTSSDNNSFNATKNSHIFSNSFTPELKTARRRRTPDIKKRKNNQDVINNSDFWNSCKLSNRILPSPRLAPTTVYNVSVNNMRFPKSRAFTDCRSSQCDSDSDLDESISGLCLGDAPAKVKKSNGIFQLKKFSSASFAAPLVVPSQRRPIISPSRLCQGTSWVAGGYWGGESNRNTFEGTSRSSSQSSGFESQSSNNMRNIFGSHPPSREESINREIDKISTMSDLQQNFKLFNHDKWAYQGRIKSPVIHPKLKYDNHVNIPNFTNSVNYGRDATFTPSLYSVNTPPPPYTSSLIKLPNEKDC